MAEGGKRDQRSAYDPQVERPSRIAELLARAGRDRRQLVRSLLMGEAVAERPHPIQPSRHRKK